MLIFVQSVFYILIFYYMNFFIYRVLSALFFVHRLLLYLFRIYKFLLSENGTDHLATKQDIVCQNHQRIRSIKVDNRVLSTRSSNPSIRLAISCYKPNFLIHNLSYRTIMTQQKKTTSLMGIESRSTLFEMSQNLRFLKIH